MPKFLCFLLALLLLLGLVARVSAAPAPRPHLNLAPTYRIFATREGLVGHQTANGHIIQPNDRFVALPSWSVLSSYQGYEYQVRLTYGDRSVVVPVWDVGPWNTNDAYWSPQRGDYPDLPIGMPMAQAAYFDGYNGGLDEFGRAINNPNGIDIADGTYWEDLGMTRNDWVNVTFLWLGEDPGPVDVAQEPIPAPPSANVPAPPAEPERPANPDPNPPADPAPPAPVDTPPQPTDNPRVEAGAIAVDNDDPGYNAGNAAWETYVCGLNGDHAWTRGEAGSSHRASWEPELATAAYEVKAYIPPCGEVAATTAARYTVFHDNGQSEVVIDQRAAEGSWVSLGIYHFGRASAPLIELSGATDDSGSAVRFDALAWKEIPDQTPPQSQIVRIVRERSGYTVEWSGEDDLSGIAGYDLQVRQLPRGGWRAWVQDKPRTSAWFGPDEGRHFAFRVRARDAAGNQEAWREGETGDMDTRQAEEEPEP